jgi:hypothetical protein
VSPLSLALAVVGLFLAVYAVVLLLGRAPEGAARRRASLGCGFVLLAGIVWGIGLGTYLEDRWAGLRLGFAAALLLPALATLLHRGRGRTAAAAVALGLAVLLGASALPGVWSRLKPSRPVSSAEDVRAARKDLEERVRMTEDHVERLEEDREDLKERVEEFGYGEFEQVAQDAAAYGMLKELAEVDRMLTESRRWLEQARHNVEQLGMAERRIERLARGEEAMGTEAEPAEIERILREARTPPPSGPITVEEHVEREQLRRLFEEEF